MTKLILAILCIGLVASYYEEPHMIISLMAQEQLLHPHIGSENRNIEIEDTKTGKTENEDTQTDELSKGQPIMHLVNKLSGLLNKRQRDDWTQSDNNYKSIIEASVWPDDIKDDPYYNLTPEKGGMAEDMDGNKPDNIQQDEKRHFYGRFYNPNKDSYDDPFGTNLLEALPRIIKNLTTWTQDEVKCLKNPDTDCVQQLYRKARDIRFLFHLMGDLHQPLHCSTYEDNHKFKKEKGGDKGGMGFILKYKDKNGKDEFIPLHRLFDAVLFEFEENKFKVRKFEGGVKSELKFKGTQYHMQAVVILKDDDYIRLNNKGREYLKTYLKEIEKETIKIDKINEQIKNWIDQSHDIAKNEVYSRLKDSDLIDLNEKRITDLKEIVIKHMVLGSYRLKLILEEIWNGFIKPKNKKNRRKLR